MPEPGKNAVFVSYASQDAEVANSLCEALRGAGIEVWFDQNELKGGDLWDIKIRKQVMACSLFVPLISQNTNEREEGYFRREWNLAVTRTLDMAHDKAFILPVMVDGIAEATARATLHVSVLLASRASTLSYGNISRSGFAGARPRKTRQPLYPRHRTHGRQRFIARPR